MTSPQHNEGVFVPASPVYLYTWDVPQLVGTDSSKPPFVYLKECSLPAYDFDTESVKTGHATYEFASGIKWDDIALSFYDTGVLADELQRLSRRTWTQGGGIRPASEYMFDSQIKVYYFDGTPAYTWKLINSWIKSIKWTKLTYESSGVGQANVTLKYTYAELKSLSGYAY
jgi:hypothetical protein